MEGYIMPRLKLYQRVLVLICILCLSWTSGCEPKPVSEVPSISGQQAPNSSERDRPDPETIAAIIGLLDPRGTNIERLDQHRAEFENRLRILLPREEDREQLEARTLLRWHRMYTKRLREHQRIHGSAREQVASVLRPQRGYQISVDDRGIVKRCRRPPPRPPEPNIGPPNLNYATPKPTECQVLPGYAQFEFQLSAAANELASVLEAQWHLLERIRVIRKRLLSNQAFDNDRATSP